MSAGLARSWWGWLAMIVVAVPLLAVAAIDSGGPATPAERVRALTEQIQCPQCAGQAVSESDVSVSREIRRDIAERVEQGETDDEIRAYYASSFGEDALLMPSASGITGLVWALPVAGLLLAGLGLGLAFRRWAAQPSTEVSEQDRRRVARALGEDP